MKTNERKNPATLNGAEQLYIRINKEEESDPQSQHLTPDSPGYHDSPIQVFRDDLSAAKDTTKTILKDSSQTVSLPGSDGEPSQSSRSCQGGSRCWDRDGYHEKYRDSSAMGDHSSVQTPLATFKVNGYRNVVMEHENGHENAMKGDEFWVSNSSMWCGIDLSIFDDMNLV
jgi:hypothetical protein